MNAKRPPSRVARWSILTLLLAIGLGGILAKYTANAALKKPPAGYIVALDDDTRVRLRWKSRRVPTTLTLAPNAVATVPAGKTVALIRSDGQQEKITGPARIQLPTSTAPGIDFLASPLGDLLSSAPSAAAEPELATGIRITSPVGVTRFRNPIIAWTAEDGATYDVAVIDPADQASPPRVRSGIRSPVPLATLETSQAPELPVDRIFAVVVRKAADPKLFGTNRFLTSADATATSLPSSAPELLNEAISALTQKPMRTGDAWLALSRLPETWKQSELAIRLRLKVASELGLTEEVTQLKTELRKL